MPVADNITGIKAIDRALDKLDKKIRKKVIKKALTKAVAEYRKEVRKNTPKRTGVLRKSVATRKSSHLRGNLLIGSTFFSRSGGKKGYHANLLEFGTRNRTIKDYMGFKKRGVRSRATRVKVGRTRAVRMSSKGFKKMTPKVIRMFKKTIARTIREVRRVN